MSLVDSIASLSVAQSMAEAKMAASMKVLKISQGQQQVVADLLTAALEDVAEMTKPSATDAGTRIDARA